MSRQGPEVVVPVPPVGTAAHPLVVGNGGRTTLGDGNGRVAAEIVAIVHDVLAVLTPGREVPAPSCDAEVVVAPGADGRAAAMEALCATADALLDARADEVAEAIYDLAYDMDQVVAALGSAWSATPPSERPLLVLRELVHRSIDPTVRGIG